MLDIDSTYQQEAQRLSNITFEPLSDSELSPTMEQQALNTLAKESLKNLSKFGGGDHEDVVKWLSDV
ncbi:unnamed protein product, partial [Adineta steineri]